MFLLYSDVTPIIDQDTFILIFHNLCAHPAILTFPMYESLISCIGKSKRMLPVILLLRFNIVFLLFSALLILNLMKF